MLNYPKIKMERTAAFSKLSFSKPALSKSALSKSALSKLSLSKKIAAIATTLIGSLAPAILDSVLSPALAQSVAPQTAGGTICAYDPSSGTTDPLGERASLKIQAAGGNVAFIYERLPAIVSSSASSQRAEVDNKRTLTLYETSLEAARQLLIDDSTYYAVLLGLSPDDPFVARGFERIDQTLTCTTNAAETTDPETNTEANPEVDNAEASETAVPEPSTPPES